MVEFARFSPATMAERYETGRLARRGDQGGVRHEVHRVATPFGSENVRDRKGFPADEGGELADRFGDVEFARRVVDLQRPWNRLDRDREDKQGKRQHEIEVEGQRDKKKKKKNSSSSDSKKDSKSNKKKTIAARPIDVLATVKRRIAILESMSGAVDIEIDRLARWVEDPALVAAAAATTTVTTDNNTDGSTADAVLEPA